MDACLSQYVKPIGVLIDGDDGGQENLPTLYRLLDSGVTCLTMYSLENNDSGIPPDVERVVKPVQSDGPVARDVPPSSSDDVLVCSMEQPDPDPIRRLLKHIAALETELARYAHKYGLTDEARQLLKILRSEVVAR